MSESFWKGAFTPNMTKSVGTVRLLPLDRMTNADWNWLDWDNLRNTAKNRLAKRFLGKTVGFLDVRLDDYEEDEDPGNRRGRAKKRYLYAATPEIVREYEDDEHEFFTHEAEVDDEVPEVAEIEYVRSMIPLYPRNVVIRVLIAMLAAGSIAAVAMQDSEDLEDVNFTLLCAIALAHVSGVSYAVATERLFRALDRELQNA